MLHAALIINLSLAHVVADGVAGWSEVAVEVGPRVGSGLERAGNREWAGGGGWSGGLEEWRVGEWRGGQQVGSWVFTLLLLCVLRASALFVVYLLSCTYLVCTCPFCAPHPPIANASPWSAVRGSLADPFLVGGPQRAAQICGPPFLPSVSD